MIDPMNIMLAGVVMQAAPAARAIFAGLRPRLRGPGLVASLAFTPLPGAHPAFDALLARIDAPATPGR